MIALYLAQSDAPWVFEELTGATWAPVLHFLTGGAALTALAALWRRHYRIARTAAAVQTALIVVGWAMAQWPYILPPTMTVYDAAAPTATLTLLVGALAAGAVILLPALAYLFAIFGKPPRNR